MRIDVEFEESNHEFIATFMELTAEFKPEFEAIQIVYDGKIPKEYGLITYNQDKTITIT